MNKDEIYACVPINSNNCRQTSYFKIEISI